MNNSKKLSMSVCLLSQKCFCVILKVKSTIVPEITLTLVTLRLCTNELIHLFVICECFNYVHIIYVRSTVLFK